MGTEGPLAGLRVLDLTNVLAGPYCCYHLGLMGAEVIKIERPDGGDLARELGADPARNAAGEGLSFLAQNAGKASVTLDLKDSGARAAFLRLVASADVLVENFRPGVMARLGLGHEALRAHHPQLIYAAISGFGQEGPLSATPAYDQIVQGMSGVMSITGDAQSAPLRVGYPLADTVGGLTAAFAISAALNARPRGGFLDISMTEAVLSTMGWVVSNHLMGGVAPQALGNENMTSAPSGTFATQDGAINIAANRDVQWAALLAVLGLEPLAQEARFASREARKAHRAALKEALEGVLRGRTTAHWVARLTAANVPAGPVLSVPEALEHPQVAARGLVGSLASDSGALSVMGAPVMVDGSRAHPQSPPPKLGADTDRVLKDLGLSEAMIMDMRARGAV